MSRRPCAGCNLDSPDTYLVQFIALPNAPRFCVVCMNYLRHAFNEQLTGSDMAAKIHCLCETRRLGVFK